MDFPKNPSTKSPSSSSSSTSSSAAHHPLPYTTTDNDPMHSWWESVSKQRSRILSLSYLLPSDGITLSSLADSDRPALSLLSSPAAYTLISSALSSPSSGSGSDPLCQWLYETFQSSDAHLRLLVLSFLPLLSGIYLSRIHSSDSSSLPSLAGFEAVLLAVYSSEAKSRSGKPILVQIPDLSQPSLYHTPRNKPVHDRSRQSVGVLSPPLEPHLAVKSTKRAIIVGTALDCYYKQVSQMPAWSKLEFCKFAAAWAGQDCPCRTKFYGDDHDHHGNSNGHDLFFAEGSRFINGTENRDDDDVDVNVEDDVIKDVVVEMDNLGINIEDAENLEKKGVRIPLPWELLRPVVTILGHCLFGPSNSQDVKDAASVAIRCLYARASHDLAPQAILALQSLIRLDKSARAAAKAAATAAANGSSNTNTPSKVKKPEILLVSK
ncbi:uncharacterized protein LOC111309120 [Durio zibethinus]|uniref:Uncharacterized protein LOC111309120 n=1 Tax=Durio zibethinus TaxID=66656 RepID=A0A6P6AFS8_DURZI|nr:uncharacterized protein LOC111309120 [Durio zibethinus]